jgi:hypothetical protein
MKPATTDWITALFTEDDGFKNFLLQQMEFVTMEPLLYADTIAMIESMERDKLRAAQKRIAEYLPTNDPRKQFNERCSVQ